MFITELFEAAQQQTLVIIPGGFHPFHPGHLSLYRSAQKAFPGATIVYAATDDQKERPFAFVDKEKLAAIAGVPERAFQMVKSPFVAREITQNFDPNTTVLIFARSEKDRDEPPKPGGVKKNGEPSYLQPYAKGDLAPMTQHGYMAYLPTVQFDAGPSGVTSATQIRNMWPQADDAQKNAIISDLYPRNPAVARQILDKYLGGGLAESNNTITEYRDRLFQYVKSLLPTWPDYILKDWLVPNKGDFSNLPPDALKNGVMEKLKNAGLTTNSKWQLVPSMKFTMDMFEPMSKKRLIGRAGGHSDMGLNVPRDKERHATQAALAQQQGGIRKEPVILIQTPQGYELLEGWHRTIQHFHMYPDGYTGPAYVAVAQSHQDVAEGLLDKFIKPKMKFNIETAGEELYVDVTLGEKQVAGFTFDMLGHDLEAQDMSVTPEYRGQGIAQTVYDMLKAKGFRINRSQHQTDAGSHFWDKNKGAGSKVWEDGVAEETVDEKSVSKAQFRTMAAAAHNPKFAKKVGISQNVAQEFHHADKKQSYKSLPNKVDEDQDVLAQLDQLAESTGIL